MSRQKYLIITNRVSSFGGAQLYTLRRANYLRGKSFDIQIVVFENQNFILEKEFDSIPIITIPTLSISPFISSKKDREETLANLKDSLQLSESNTIIETHTPLLAIWGELLATEVNAKHIIYFLSEPILSSNLNKPFKKFFVWKMLRKELYGITDLSLKLIFGGEFRKDNNNFVNVPFDAEEIKERTYPNILSAITKDSIVIATLSRLGKSYIEPFIISVINISKKNRRKKILLIVAGDDANKDILPRLKRKYANRIDNLSIIFPGYLNPIGRDFFKRINVFVGMGTAAINSISQKCATIVVEPHTNKAMGILGVTTSNFAYSDKSSEISMESLIESLLDDKDLMHKAKEDGYRLYEQEFSLVKCMNKLDNLIINCNDDKIYWDFSGYEKFPSKANLIIRHKLSKIFTYILKLKIR